MKIAILNFEHAVMSSVMGPYDMLNQTKSIVDSFRPDIRIDTIETVLIDDDNLNDTTIYDLVIIPAMHFNHVSDVLENSTGYIKWLQMQYSNGAELASICLGAFLLASTGLIDNKSATTHWMGADQFRQLFPNVNLVDDKIITDYQRIYTCGGAYSFTTLMIYLIDKFFGHEVAILVSKVFLIHIHDSRQTAYNILNLQKNHDNDSIQKVQDYIEENSSTNFTINDLAALANMTSRTFIRNFKKATGDTPFVYIQKVKVEKAKKLLEMEDIGIEQVCFEVGYSDFTSFRNIFKKNVGVKPSEYKKLYGKTQTPEYISVLE